MKKKILAVLMSVAVAATMLVGCSSDTSGMATDESVIESTAEIATESAAEIATESAAEVTTESSAASASVTEETIVVKP